ncbi:sensor domain-containing diguanylate cyclase [candidate division WOR-3 bacterium]|nr:sensor domain-containing diguanylate cyclase [candidate division WOR-3 bacterium]
MCNKGNKTAISIIKPTVTSGMIINSESRPIEEMEIKSVIKNNNHRDILDNLFEGVYFTDINRRITFWNKGAEKITGYKKSQVLGKYCNGDFLIYLNKQGKTICETKSCPILKSITEKKLFETEAYILHKEGQRIPVLIRTFPIRDEKEKIIGAAGIFSNNSIRMSVHKKMEELSRLAMFDSITEIGTRKYIEINLFAILDEMRRYGWTFGVLLIDIDHFKKVNDTYGHDIGDKVLKMVAKTLSKNLRSFDIIGRWGGEEFIGIIVNINEDQLYSIAEKLRLLIEKSSLNIGGAKIQVTISTGAALAQLTDTVETLVKRVDKLMYNSKSSGRNRVSMKFGIE